MQVKLKMMKKKARLAANSQVEAVEHLCSSTAGAVGIDKANVEVHPIEAAGVVIAPKRRGKRKRVDIVSPAHSNPLVPPVEETGLVLVDSTEALAAMPKQRPNKRKVVFAGAGSTPVSLHETEELVPPAPKRKVDRPKLARHKKPPSLYTFELSITVSIGGQDIDKSLISNVNAFIQENTLAGKCSLERGGAAFHLHMQMVIRIESSSVIAVSRKLKTYLGWDKKQPASAGGMVMCRKLTNKGLHTFAGMIGYCMKDSNQPHFETIDHNISAADIALGFEQYSLYGKEENKHRVVLTMTNFVDRVYQWRRFNCKHPMVVDFGRDIYEMMKTGKYYPSPGWVVGGSGRGYEPYRIQSLYRMMVCPADVSRTDIRNVFEMPEIYKRLEIPRSQWFDERFQDGVVVPPPTTIPIKRALFADLEHSRRVDDAENYKESSFVDKETSEIPVVVVDSDTDPLDVLCAAALETPKKAEDRLDRKGKKKKLESPTRHLWPPEWCVDRNSSTSTDSSCGPANCSVPLMPGYIPLCTARRNGVHIA